MFTSESPHYSRVLFLLSCPRAKLSKKFICIKQNAQLLSKNVRETCWYDLKTVITFVTPFDCNTAMPWVSPGNEKLFLCRTTNQEKKLNSLKKMQINFLLRPARENESCLQCPWIMTTLTFKHKICERKLVHWSPKFIVLHVFNYLETCRPYKLMINLEIDKFLKKIHRAVSKWLSHL